MALPINSLYSLTWGDYGASLVSAIQLLRCHGDLVDCTLAAGGRSFAAHKIVLCAASPFLFELLKNTPCKHPVVMLAGVNPNDLEALLEFVYRGEVSVDHSQLPSLLQAAHCLNIQGLAPQTVAKEDFTQIQLHQMVPQHSEPDQLIATIAAPQQTVHAQVVEDINTIQTINAAPTQIHQVQAQNQDNVKDMINQLLPTRKRKPRAKKITGVNESPSTAKIQRTSGMETILTSGNENLDTNQPTQNIQQLQNQHQIQTPQQMHIQTAQSPQIATVTLSTPSLNSNIKTENSSEKIINQSPVSTLPTQTTTEIVTNKVKGEGSPGKISKKDPRSRSQSEQPATCPICYAVIRQSRNLRRHLELRHFAKPGVKKERKTGASKKSVQGSISKQQAQANVTLANTSATTQLPQIQTVQTLHALQSVQVKKDPDQVTMTTPSNMTPVAVTVSTGNQHHTTHNQHQQSSQSHLQNIQQQPQSAAIIDQSGHIATSSNAQQQIVTQTENSDGTTSLSIAQVQGHQLQLSNLNQVNINDFTNNQ